MAFSDDFQPSKRDLRSSSIPHFRHSSKRAKYGGPPPTDAFLLDTSDIAWKPQLGKPTADIASSQKYRVAQDTVARLIGKHVNRNNQRTGERDPWNHFGAGRRWAKQVAKGKDMDMLMKVYIPRDIHTCWDDDHCYQYDHCDKCSMDCGGCASRCGGQLYEPHQRWIDLWKFVKAIDVEIKTARRKRPAPKHQFLEFGHEWDFVARAENHVKPETDDGWEILTESSGPGWAMASSCNKISKTDHVYAF
ncbi:MAG: hypothetical protein Q9218_007702 [Villophora microphyllina]